MAENQNWLAQFVETGSDAAFRNLVAGYVDLVYSTALRLVGGNPHQAEDVTQSVFIKLARVAGRLPPDVKLGGWLHRDTCFTASTLRRSELRRQTRERQAAEMDAKQNNPAADYSLVAPVLDEAINELDEGDRTAIVLRFFEQTNYRAIGVALNTTEDAARMRVARALEKLEGQLRRRGITTPAASLGGVLAANAVQAAPAGLALTASTAALTGTILTTSTTVTATKAITMTALQKTLVAATVAVLAGAGIYEARQASNWRNQLQTLQQHQATLRPPANHAALANLQDEIAQLALRNSALTTALAQATADKNRLETERNQATRAAELYKELADLKNAKNATPTNTYPTVRHVWVGWGRLGRVAALSKADSGQLSAEEKSALETARAQALEELPSLVKAAKQFTNNEASETDSQKDAVSDEVMDMVTCILYGALNLDEQQFNQVYGVMEKLKAEAKQEGLSKETPAPESAAAIKRYMARWQAETQSVLTADQIRIFTEVATHFQVEPGKFGFNFNF